MVSIESDDVWPAVSTFVVPDGPVQCVKASKFYFAQAGTELVIITKSEASTIGMFCPFTVEEAHTLALSILAQTKEIEGSRA
jgi:hypothetical protein